MDTGIVKSLNYKKFCKAYWPPASATTWRSVNLRKALILLLMAIVETTSRLHFAAKRLILKRSACPPYNIPHESPSPRGLPDLYRIGCRNRRLGASWLGQPNRILIHSALSAAWPRVREWRPRAAYPLPSERAVINCGPTVNPNVETRGPGLKPRPSRARHCFSGLQGEASTKTLRGRRTLPSRGEPYLRVFM